MRTYKSEGSFLVKLLRNATLILLLVIFISIVLHLRNRESDTVSALFAEASASDEYRGVFVRSEEPIRFSGRGTLSYNVSDGGRLGKGTLIAEVYPDDSQISINGEKAKLGKKLELLEKIQNPGTRESAQPASLSESIEEDYRSLICSRDLGDYSSMEKAMDDILVHMSTYQLITDETVDFSQQTVDVRSQLTALEQNSIQPIEPVTAERSAYFVSYCDGYEEKFTKENIGFITINDIRSVTDDRLTDSNIVGKLVDGYTWYLLVIADNSRKIYSVGENVSLRFDSSADLYGAEIIDIRNEGDPSESILTLSCEQFNSDLVQHRVEDVELIKEQYRGLKVPREAIRFLDIPEKRYDSNDKEYEVTSRKKGVYTRKGEQVTFKQIDVIYEGSDYVLSKSHPNDSDFLTLYDDIVLEGVD